MSQARAETSTQPLLWCSQISSLPLVVVEALAINVAAQGSPLELPKYSETVSLGYSFQVLESLIRLNFYACFLPSELVHQSYPTLICASEFSCSQMPQPA